MPDQFFKTGQKVREKGTDTILDVRDFGKGGQLFSQDFELFDPEKKEETLPSFAESVAEEGNDIVDGAGNLFKEEEANKSDATSLLGDIDESLSDERTDIAQRKADLEATIENSRILTPADEQAINEAGTQAGLEFDPLISDAEAKARQGRAKATIRGGEGGGFISTQIAGIAAISPTIGGTFEGAGGELARIGGQLDRNIQNLQIAKKQAIADAKSSARKALKTGKREDIEDAQSLFDLAQKAFDNEQSLIDKRIDRLTKIQTATQNSIKFTNEQNELASKNFASSVLDVDDEGNVIAPTLDEILGLAEEQGIAPEFLIAAINTRIEELEKIEATKRKDALAEKNAGLTSGLKEFQFAQQEDGFKGTYLDYVRTKANAQRKPTTTPSPSVSLANRQLIKDEIGAIRGKEDGFVDTAKYQKLREKIAIEEPKLLSFFDDTYPAQDVMNPNDPTAKKFFQTGLQQITEEDTETDFDKRVKEYKEIGVSLKDTIKAFKESGFKGDEVEKNIEKAYNK